MINPAASDNRLAASLGKHNFSAAYSSLALFSYGPAASQAAFNARGFHGARFELEEDLTPLFPYINAVADQPQYYERPVYIKFVLSERLCGLYPRQGAFTPVRDIAEALAFLPQLLNFIAEVARRSPDIVPSYKKFKPASALDIYRLLPGSNCRRCGYATCLAFAAALSRRRTSMVQCPHLANPMEEKATFPVYDDRGNLVRTVTLDIDTACLREQIDRKESHIRDLQSRLSDVEHSRAANIDSANAGLPAPLTSREIQVLRLMARGATNKEISKELHISEHTAKSHVIHIFNKLGVNDRAQASTWGALNGVL